MASDPSSGPKCPSSTLKRQSRRVAFSSGIPVQIVGLDGAWRLNCLMMDVSFGGAKLEVEPSMVGFNLKDFFLVLSTTGTVYRRCELVWRNGEQLGVRFLDPADNSPKIKSPGKA